jgi:Lon protease-like protein
MINLPKIISVFPLSNFIIFPNLAVPLNIFEPRYIEMINHSMKNNRMIGMIQPKKMSDKSKTGLYEIGCLGKITSFDETEDGRYSIVLKGLSRFKIVNELKNNKSYRECEVDFKEFEDDVKLDTKKNEQLNLETIFKNLKLLFKKRGYVVNLKELEKQNIGETINTLSMSAPFLLEEKQALLESQNLNSRKNNLEKILKTYIADNFNNTTIQ